jgi:hypothetical protein
VPQTSAQSVDLHLAQIIALADFNAVVPKNGIGRGDMKINIGHGVVQ